MKIPLIVNPYAGGKKGKKLLPLIEKKLSINHVDYHIYTSLYHGHILKITSELKIKDYDAIITIGGDGTNFYVLNGLLSSFKARQLPPLGIIPVGSGNSFAKDLNIHHYEDGIRSIVENNPRWIDVCSFTQAKKQFYFVNLIGLGIVDPNVKTVFCSI